MIDIAHELALRMARSQALGARLNRIATTIRNLHRGFSFDPSENGEHALIDTVLRIKGSESPPFLFIDVGAHLGRWSAYLVARIGSRPFRGHLFEPTPERATELVQRFAHEERVLVHRIALADFTGSHQFVVRGVGGESNSLAGSNLDRADTQIQSTIKVSVTKGDLFLADRGQASISLLKIDTEGWDLDVLRGFEQALRDQSICVIQFEYALPNARTRRLMADFYAFLEPLGYRIGPLRPDGVRFAPYTLHSNHFDSGPNYVAALPAFVPLLSKFAPRKR